MPAASASRMAAIESRSSWAPQANSQPPPPIAHAPKPIGVMCRSEVPSCLVSMSAVSLGLGRVHLRNQHDGDGEPAVLSLSTYAWFVPNRPLLSISAIY